MRRCENCVLPESYPGISFDKDGVCNYCRSYRPIVYAGEAALRKVFNEHPSESKWDCLVPLSGGRDSSFTLYQLVTKYGRRVLVYNYDNGFVEGVARENIQHIADQLSVEVVYRKSKNDIQCKNIKYLTKMNIKKSPGHVQAFLCSGCRNGIWGGAYEIAKDKGIPLIVFGESSMESGGFKKLLKPLFTPTTAEKILFMLRMPVNFYQRKMTSRQLEGEFPSPPVNSDIKQVNFFDYEAWNEKVIMGVIQNKLNWKHKDGQSAWRFDCQIHALVNRMVFQLLGMTEKDELYSKMIREGQIDRATALEKIQANIEEQGMELQIIEKLLGRIELEEGEKSKILAFCHGQPKMENRW